MLIDKGVAWEMRLVSLPLASNTMICESGQSATHTVPSGHTPTPAGVENGVDGFSLPTTTPACVMRTTDGDDGSETIRSPPGATPIRDGCLKVKACFEVGG
jgi:hypothetical protein